MRIKDISMQTDGKIEVVFFSGDVKVYDIRPLCEKCPEYFEALKNPRLWKNARILPQGSGIYFNDDLDLTSEELWKEGKFEKRAFIDPKYLIAVSITDARTEKGISQQELSRMTGISQCDISRIEGAVANPTLETLSKIFKALEICLSCTAIA